MEKRVLKKELHSIEFEFLYNVRFQAWQLYFWGQNLCHNPWLYSVFCFPLRFIYLYFMYMSVLSPRTSTHHLVCLVPVETRERWRWNQSHSWLWASMWVLRPKPRSSASMARAFSPVPNFILLEFFETVDSAGISWTKKEPQIGSNFSPSS